MKPSVTPDATRAVLADIADAVRPVERARTAAAVDRVLRTASRGCSETLYAWDVLTRPLLDELGLTAEPLGDLCPFCMLLDRETDNGLDGWFLYYLNPSNVPEDERQRYAPWVVSPHLFDTRSDPTPSGSNQRRRVTTEQGEG